MFPLTDYLLGKVSRWFARDNGAYTWNIGPAPGFLPLLSASPVTLTATNASQRVQLGNARTVRLRAETASGIVRIKFGDSAVTVAATDDLEVQTADGPQIFKVPATATDMAYIRDSTMVGNVTVNLAFGD